MNTHATTWIEKAELDLGDLISVVSLLIAFGALKIAKDQKLLDLMATRSGALLTHWEILPTDDPSICMINTSFEARGPVPFYDVRLCLWDAENNIIQLNPTQCNVLSSSDPSQVATILTEQVIVKEGYVGLAWSEPHRHNLITMARRWPLAITGTPPREEHWKWTPFLEKASFGRWSGRWKKVHGYRMMFLARPNGPTINKYHSFYAEVLHSDSVPPRRDFFQTQCDSQVTPPENSTDSD